MVGYLDYCQDNIFSFRFRILDYVIFCLNKLRKCMDVKCVQIPQQPVLSTPNNTLNLLRIV